jgi:hypothetical protein
MALSTPDEKEREDEEVPIVSRNKDIQMRNFLETPKDLWDRLSNETSSKRSSDLTYSRKSQRFIWNEYHAASKVSFPPIYSFFLAVRGINKN